MAEAGRCYEQVLAAAPAHADALHLLGLVRLAGGRLDEGIALIRRCVALQPRFAEAHNNLGTALAAREQWSEAVAAYLAAIEIKPDYAEACNNLGLALQGLGRIDDAITAFRRALALNPSLPEVHNNLALALQAKGDLAAAITVARHATTLQPGYAPGFANLGKILLAAGHPAEAAEACRRALALQPGLIEAHANLGAALDRLGHFDDAAAAFREAAARAPDSASTHSNYGAALERLHDYDGALVELNRALALDPNHADAHNNLGFVLHALTRNAEAIPHFETALRLAPAFAGARFNLALAQLVSGDFPNGWKNFEARWESEQRAFRRDFPAPLWLGDAALEGKRILIHAEQGLGDTLQFCRYVPLAAARGATVYFEVQRPLVPLMSSLPGVARVLAQGEPLPEFDLHCPLLSLPLAFNTTVATVPPLCHDIQVPAEARAHWAQRLAGFPGLRVGLAWAGNPNCRYDRRRSMALATIRPLFAGLPCTFFSLQPRLAAAEVPLAQETANFVDLSAEAPAFIDTAAMVANLDLVISVDTSMTHLAGTLGRPVWLLLPFAPECRWMLSRDDSPWYPTVRLFRQPRPGDWPPVLAAARTELERLLAGRESAPARGN